MGQVSQGGLCLVLGSDPVPLSPQDHSHLLYSTIPRMQDPGQIVEETYTMEEDPEGAMSVVSVETSDDGTTRRTETTVGTWVGRGPAGVVDCHPTAPQRGAAGGFPGFLGPWCGTGPPHAPSAHPFR